jgi:hypothetical protein
MRNENPCQIIKKKKEDKMMALEITHLEKTLGMKHSTSHSKLLQRICR